MAISGCPDRAGDLRDAVHLARPGDLSGPAGAVYLTWQQAVARPITRDGLQRALPEIAATRIVGWLASGEGAPVSRAATALETVLTEAPRAEVLALILADAALAQALRQEQVNGCFDLFQQGR
ncbi:hypothetical protein P775_02855 [Puniceibacterium antarcticum]|uniref:Uncharacterized protein n=1 Tax=Puniceibacterium antarcticum TaxID=1206336 RepID=A0A2G8RJR1_9RHOB|nr:hypothetical protein P775_02855 [Puniceibacterium antarcticum]